MEVYFTTDLTENEHGYVQEDIRKYCAENNLEMIYYRSFKTGHIPCQRECKIKGFDKRTFEKFIEWCDTTSHITLGNYWREQKELTEKYEHLRMAQ
jgi:hypothetical protein